MRHLMPTAAAVLALTLAAAPATADEASFVFTDTPYLSEADIPVGFYAGGQPTLLENFEDGALDASLRSTSGLSIIAPGGITDSVDGDDGSIDGSGAGGRSIFGGQMRFDFVGTGPLPTAFGLVWTDHGGPVDATFSAFDAGGNSLGSIVRRVGDNTFASTTAEDRFFGVQFAGGISAIAITSAGGAQEVDHVQWGFATAPVPEPHTWALMLVGLPGLAAVARRRQCRA
jgi:hypothetical protein